MHNISIDTLSVIARQCIAVTCLQRFCQRFDIHHPALSAFAGHMWKLAQVGPGDFAAWERGFAALSVTGMGDPWPEEVRMSVPGHLLGALDELVGHVLETSACTWYGADRPASRRQLQAVFDICVRHDVAAPPLEYYAQHDAAQRDGWGPILTDGEVRRWQALI